MTAVFSSTALRALLLAVALACVAALTAPTARGDEAGRSRPAAGSHDTTAIASLPAARCPLTAPLALSEEFSWSEFCKYWGRQAGSMQGVVGTVMLVALAAVLIILSKGRG
jgi:hypothetical protein